CFRFTCYWLIDKGWMPAHSWWDSIPYWPFYWYSADWSEPIRKTYFSAIFICGKPLQSWAKPKVDESWLIISGPMSVIIILRATWLKTTHHFLPNGERLHRPPVSNSCEQ